MFAYIVFFAVSSLFLMFLFLFIVASIIDYYHYRQHRTFYELQRDYSKPRKPAAK
jgi:uncharacterized membrane protein